MLNAAYLGVRQRNEFHTGNHYCDGRWHGVSAIDPNIADSEKYAERENVSVRSL